MGVALAEALDPAGAGGGASIGLKWPNDLMRIEGTQTPRKLGGVLIESVPVGQRRMVVIGLGLNIATAAGGRSEHRLRLHAGVRAPASTRPHAGAHRKPWVEAVLLFQREGFAPFKPRFDRLDCLKGRIDYHHARRPAKRRRRRR